MTRALAYTPVAAADRWLHASLVTVWLGTAAVSALELRGQSVQLLADAGLHDPRWQAVLIAGGSAADLLVGLWLAWRPGRASGSAALGLMAVMTVAATVLQPALWLHPLGPLLKNLPIAAALLHLMRTQPAQPPGRHA
ncbi:DoxX-like family protein [Xenophilus sp. Marseille-Q4582]|uniref:DoxX-like family protein n=1 Tax=Xenophilus sp. Marseille-Q4582 TaxID=2866600 RepID=UPI001CE47036|nr:DoxX-like family protein [Xenophilus sp. Marseille-Q4582]